jgi:alginate O-acetyltransferase complex protein AlgI
MLFNSLQFLVFFPVVTAIYFASPHRYRWAVIVSSSCIFYMSFIPSYLLLLAGAVTVNYFLGLCIEKARGRARRQLFVLTVGADLALLFVFKYLNFFTANLSALAQFLHWNYSIKTLHLLLPIGISFYTFQILSYIIEVYRGNQKAERRFGVFAAYIMFFPQLLSGPISRPQQLLHQFDERHIFDYARVTDGLKLAAWGLFKKVVIADRLTLYVSEVYDHPLEYKGISFLIATFFFAFQLYCDFSGYADMAIGFAKVLGFTLPENFRQPFFSRSISDFWNRWHMTLSGWLRDYVYTPLSIDLRDWGVGGSMISLMITFMICGFWHGATWNFLLVGFLFGVALCYELLTKKTWKKIWKRTPKSVEDFVSVGGTFLFVCLTLIFFRANTLHDSLYITTHLFSGIGDFVHQALTHRHEPAFKTYARGAVFLGQPKGDLALALGLVGLLIGVHAMQARCQIREWLRRQPWGLRWSVYYVGIIVMLAFGAYYGGEFIYFKF